MTKLCCLNQDYPYFSAFRSLSSPVVCCWLGKYLTVIKLKKSSHSIIKAMCWIFYYIDRLSLSSYTRDTNFWKWSRFFRPTQYCITTTGMYTTGRLRQGDPAYNLRLLESRKCASAVSDCIRCTLHMQHAAAASSIMTNNNHVLYSYLPERRCLIYNLRERYHNRSLITKTTYLKEHDFFMRILYKNCYCLIPSCV